MEKFSEEIRESLPGICFFIPIGQTTSFSKMKKSNIINLSPEVDWALASTLAVNIWQWQ